MLHLQQHALAQLVGLDSDKATCIGSALAAIIASFDHADRRLMCWVISALNLLGVSEGSHTSLSNMLKLSLRYDVINRLLNLQL